MTTIVQSYWVFAGSGSWGVAANWGPAVVPTYNAKTATEYDVTLGVTTAGASDFTVTSSANAQIGFLTVDPNATLDITGGAFTVFSEVYSGSPVYNLGAIDIAHGAAMLFGSPGSPSYYSSDIVNGGSVDVAGSFKVYSPWFALYGAGSVALAGGTILGATIGGGNPFYNISNTISGYGTIGNGAAATGGNGLSLTNDNLGTIDASGGTLVLNTGSNAIENAGTIEANQGSVLKIESTLYDDGQLDDYGGIQIVGAAVEGSGNASVSAGGSVTLNNGQFGNNGIISIAAATAASAGLLSTTTGNTTGVGLNNVLAGDVLFGPDIQNDGIVSVANNSTLNYYATMYGAGKVELNSSTGPTILEIFNTYGGFYQTGGIVLSDSAKNFIESNGAGANLRNYTTISGAGTIGDGFLRFVNNTTGVVDANGSVGLAILGDSSAIAAGTELENYNDGTIETTGSGGLTITGQLTNAGYLDAYLKTAGSGSLTLDGTQIDSGDGIVEATGYGSIILKDNAFIHAQADLSISLNGTLATTAGDTSDSIEANVFNNGTVNVVSNSVLILDASWQNAGLLNIGSAKLSGVANSATIDIRSGASWYLLGGGTVVLNSANGAVSSILSGGAGTSLNNDGNTIQGSGVIGDANMFIGNYGGGVIDANGAGGLVIDTAAPSQGYVTMYNTGTMESSSRAGLILESAVTNQGKLIANTNGYVHAEEGVYGAGVAILNGTGSIEFGAEVDNDVFFGSGSGGALIIDQSASFYGNIHGLSANDTIDLRDFAYTPGQTEIDTNASSFGALDATLILTNGTVDSSPFYLDGNYTAANLAASHLAFQFSSDGHEIGATGTFGTDIKLVSTLA